MEVREESMVDKKAIIGLVENLDRLYVTEQEEYEAFIHTLINGDLDADEGYVMDNAYHFVTSQILSYFAKLGLDVEEEINKRDDLIFAKINKSIEDHQNFRSMVEKEFDLPDQFDEIVKERIRENIRKYEEEQGNNGMA